VSRYRYVAYNVGGQREDGIVEFATENQAWDSLLGLGLTVIDLQSDGQAKPSLFSNPFQRSLSLDVQADLAEQLAVLFAARLPVTDIVAVIQQGAERPALKQHFGRMAGLMADGMDFPQALEQAGPGLSPLFLSLARVGQASADPAPLMRTLASFLRRQEKLQAQISGALIYPLILLIGGIAVFLMMALYLAPALEPMFVSVNRPIPTGLAAFLWIGNVVRAQGVFLALGLLALILGGTLVARRQSAALKRLILYLPIWGSIARSSSLSRLSRSLQLMLAAGKPLASALRDTATYLSNEPFAPLFAEASVAIEAGASASSVFATDTRLPSVFRELFSLGERTNTLAGITDALATALEDRAERQTGKATQLVTPVLTLIVGGGIGTLVYAVMGAILSVNDLAF
jgi:general secretion pathway protein F